MVSHSGGGDFGAGRELFDRTRAVVGEQAVDADEDPAGMPGGIDGQDLVNGGVGDFQVLGAILPGLARIRGGELAVLGAGGGDAAALADGRFPFQMDLPRGVSGPGLAGGEDQKKGEAESAGGGLHG